MYLATSQFAVECACGTKARGERLPKHQVIACPNCGRPLFVFPLCAAPFASASGAQSWGVGRTVRRERLYFWLMPTVAGLAALMLVGIIVLAIVRGYRPAGTTPVSPPVGNPGQRIADHLHTVQTALTDGSYMTALRELDAATELHAQFPHLLEPDKVREIVRWRRQVALLADLLSESVNEIVQHSVGLPEREWDAVFRERYAGRSLLLDARVFRDAAGHYRVDYQLDAAGAVGTWEFDRLQLLERIPLAQPQRLLFGFRVRSVRRTARDRWAVVPEPDSGVLLTDAIMLAGLSMPTDPELLELLKRQAAWDES